MLLIPQRFYKNYQIKSSIMLLCFSIIFLSFLATESRAMVLDDLDDKSLNNLNPPCYPYDTCSVPFTGKTYLTRNCECDPECHKYSDCCIDAPTTGSRSRNIRWKVSCLNYNDSVYQGVYAIDKCLKKWPKDSEVLQKCEAVEDNSDPLFAAPMTDTSRQVTFKNRYCVECNNANRRNLLSWIIRIQCDSLADFNDTFDVISKEHILDNLAYEAKLMKWGIYHWDMITSIKSFLPCELSYVLPSYLGKKVRFCRPNMVSSCDPSWPKDEVKQQCDSYMSAVYIDSRPYKNSYCALCNNLQGGSCTPEILEAEPTVVQESPYTLLVDVNPGNEGILGVATLNKECPANLKWDPFFRTCRKLVCALPGYELVKSNCVLQ